jgi:hypothetical protein
VIRRLALLLCLFAGPAWSQCSSLPFTLLNGTLADATQVMANFNCTALINSPSFIGIPLTPTPAPGNNSNQIANTAFVAASFAPLNSPAFTGIPTAPTAPVTTNSQQLATTAFVQTTTNQNLTTPTITSPTLVGVITGTPTWTSPQAFANLTTINGFQLSIGGALTTSANVAFNGAFTVALTATGATALTLPTSGTVTALGNTVTGSGGTLVEQTSPSLITPALGVATATTINGVTIPSATDTAALIAATQNISNKTFDQSTNIFNMASGGTGVFLCPAFVAGSGYHLQQNASNCTVSDPRLKEDFIAGDLPGLAELRALHPGSFRWRDMKMRETHGAAGRDVGFSAVELRKYLPAAVSVGGDTTMRLEDGTVETIHGTLGGDYDHMDPWIVRSIQQLADRLDAVEAAALVPNPFKAYKRTPVSEVNP